MPLLTKIGTFSFDKDSYCSTTSFVFIKNLLLLINFLSMLAGLILIFGGGYIISNAAEDLLGLSTGIASASIAIGAIVSIISFLGCFGAANEKRLLLKTYFVLLMVLVILEIGVGAAAYAKRDDIPSHLSSAWTYAATGPGNTTITSIEQSLKCCGFSNVTDYAVPSNCANSTTLGYGFQQPCEAVLTDSLVKSLDTIGGAGVAIGIIEFIGLIFSAVMFRKIARKENAQASLLNEAWRVNRTKVQYGYQNYQYV